MVLFQFEKISIGTSLNNLNSGNNVEEVSMIFPNSCNSKNKFGVNNPTIGVTHRKNNKLPFPMISIKINIGWNIKLNGTKE